MAATKFAGVIVPMITPFRRDFSLDLEATRWLARKLAGEGITGLFPCSTAGEFVHLSRGEKEELIRAVVEEAGGKTRVLPGICANCTLECIELGRMAADLGADGVVVTPPFYFRLKRDHLYKHFSEIAERVDLPIIVYNIPSLTGNPIPIDLYVQLAEEYGNVVGCKITLDSTSYIRRLIEEVKSSRRDFSVLTGLDDHLLNTLVLGGDGGIVGCANFAAKLHVELYEAFREGDCTRAHEAHRRISALMAIYDVASSFPTAIKSALKLLGAPIEPVPRPPLTPEPPEVEEAIRKILERVGLL